MKIVVAGGSGFVGSALINKLLDANHDVILLTRNTGKLKSDENKSLRVEIWDGKTSGGWNACIDGSDVVINLAGENLGVGRWTKLRKEKIINSRIDSTRAIVGAIAKSKSKPKLLINASGVGYYGNVSEGDVTEKSQKGMGFLSEVCSMWEGEAMSVEKSGVRSILLRSGLVLSKDGGALPRMILPFKLFVGGSLGTGKQWFPWIHLEDAIGIILFAIQNENLSGAVNAVAPESITMKQFSHELGRAMHRPAIMSVPSFMLKIVLGEMSKMVLEGQKAIPKKLSEAGFVFQYPNLHEALENIFEKSN